MWDDSAGNTYTFQGDVPQSNDTPSDWYYVVAPGLQLGPNDLVEGVKPPQSGPAVEPPPVGRAVQPPHGEHERKPSHGEHEGKPAGAEHKEKPQRAKH